MHVAVSCRLFLRIMFIIDMNMVILSVNTINCGAVIRARSGDAFGPASEKGAGVNVT